MKSCTGCNQDKPLTCFTKNKAAPDGKSYYCKVCLKDKAASRKEYQKAYYQENKDRLYAPNLARKNKWRNDNRERVKANGRARYQQNPGPRKAKSAKNRAARVQATPRWLTEAHIEEMKSLYNSCPSGYHVDHVIPINGNSVCGLHVPWNLQYLSAEENLKKSNKLVPDFTHRICSPIGV